MSTLVKTEGIVLNHHFYGESSVIVHVYTRAFGRQSYIVNSVRGSRKNKKTQLLQPLNRLWMEVYHSPKRELHRIREFELKSPLMLIPFSQGRRAQAFFITEMVVKILSVQEPAPEIYDFLSRSVDLLDSSTPGHENLHLYILFQLTRLLGFQPVGNHSCNNPWFDLQNGCFTSSEPSHPLFLAPPRAAKFARFFNTELHDLKRLATNVTERTFLLDALLDYYRLHVRGFGELRSLKVLHDMLHPSQFSQ